MVPLTIFGFSHQVPHAVSRTSSLHLSDTLLFYVDSQKESSVCPVHTDITSAVLFAGRLAASSCSNHKINVMPYPNGCVRHRAHSGMQSARAIRH